jgi:hypothetical protein
MAAAASQDHAQLCRMRRELEQEREAIAGSMLKLVEEREAWQVTMASRDTDLTDQLAAVVAFRQELLQWHADVLAREDTMQAKEQAWQQQLAELDVALGFLHELARLRQATKEPRASTTSAAATPPSDMALQAVVGEVRMSEAISMAASSCEPRASTDLPDGGIRAHHLYPAGHESLGAIAVGSHTG